MVLNKSIWQKPTTIILVFIVIASVRFNRNSFLVDRGLHDAAYYMSNVEYFRGDVITSALAAPFNERLLVCLVAAVLPFHPMTAINLVNLVFLLCSIYVLSKTLNLFGVKKGLAWTGLYMFVISFPTFYYSTIGYVDSGVLLMVFLGNFAIWSNKPWLFLISMILGTLAKEGIIVLIPVAIAYGISTGSRLWILYGFFGLALYLGIWGAVKNFMPKTLGTTPILFWKPSHWRIESNLSRFSFYFSSLFSLGVPGLLFGYLLIKRRFRDLVNFKRDLPLLSGFLGGGALWIYGIFSAYADGRFFWITSCFPIILCLVWISRFNLSTSEIKV